MRLSSVVALAVALGCASCERQPDSAASESSATAQPAANTAPDSVLRHIVAFKFSDSVSAAAIRVIGDHLASLRDSIPGIVAFESGINNSPENLSKGINHVYQLSFESAAARDAYLPHPAHQRFVKSLDGRVADVYVVDYWARSERSAAR